MKKRYGLFLGLFLLCLPGFSQEKIVDSTAVRILDRMSTLVGDINSLGFTTRIWKDVAYSDDFFIKEFESSEIKLKGPNKFYVNTKGERKSDLYFYNGDQVIYYSLLNNIYTAAAAPDNLIETLDWLYQSFDIEFTIADFLFPDFTEQLVESMDRIEYLGQVHIDGKPLFHIGASNERMTVQFWIEEGFYFFPSKILITYLGDPYAHQVEASFTEWKVNEDYPDPSFEFLPPPAAKQITWIEKN
ncbi:DUF2092 domain-containing protein [Algoriphagus vanfongensis]|uniref:DUF2092 domain-containing protein n=1 Tax=Algoriphagus vanfongensis TaxID=426371 RepID=UPI00040D9A2C|nr:DUF2092 domain-containing protein [Algoriphagus vanfongensis]